MKPIWIGALAIGVMAGCAVVRPGEVGFVQTTGQLSERSTVEGSMGFNPFTSKPIKVNTRIVEVYNELLVPSKEGLSVSAEISLLYHVDPARAKDVYMTFGTNYEEVAVASNLRATTREVCARYEVKELYSTEREKIEQAIAQQLSFHIGKWGFIIDAVLLKDIVMPKEITASIQQKVEAEQQALTMDFIIQKQKKEAERLMIEAIAVRAAQDTINGALTEEAIQYRYIEMMRQLSTSPNSKVIVVDSKQSLMLD